MAGTSNFQQWNPSSANQDTDAEYAADAQRAGGAANGQIFDDKTANKLFYQLSTFIAAFAASLANKNYNLADTSLSTLQGVLANVVTYADLKPNMISVPFSTTPVFDASLANGFSIFLSGDVTSSTLINIVPNQILTFYIVSNNPGVLNFAWPSNVIGAPIVKTQSSGNLLTFQFVSDGSNVFALSTFLDYLEVQVQNAQAAADAAQSTATAAAIAAGNAQGTANTAETAAAAAQSTANTAVTNAATAQSTANTAIAEIAALTLTATQTDETGSRSNGGIYQNTTGLPMYVSGYFNTNGSAFGGVFCHVGSGSPSTIISANQFGATTNAYPAGFSFMVPPGWFYQVTTSGSASFTLENWTETTLSII